MRLLCRTDPFLLRPRGRYAVGISDAPVRTPMSTLAECVEPGAPPGEEALRVYIARLREGGFSVSVLLAKFQQCGIGTTLAVHTSARSRVPVLVVPSAPDTATDCFAHWHCA